MDSDPSDTLTSDEIYVLKQGKHLGPFTRERLRTALASRELNPEDFAQTGSVPIWQPLARIIGDVEVELRGAIAPDWKSLLQWAWLRLRYDIDERSEIAGSVCLGVGLLVLALSHWTFLFWLPWIGGALLAAVALLQRRRFVAGILLLIGVILLPLGVFIWHAKLKPAGALPFQSSNVAAPEEPMTVDETTDATAEPETPPEPAEPKTPEAAPTIQVAPPRAEVPALPPPPVLAAAPVAGTKTPPTTPPAPATVAMPAADAVPAIAKTPEAAREPAPSTPDAPKLTGAAQGGALLQQHRTALVVVKDRKGSGSGFVAKAGDKTWLFTNIHVSARMAAPEFARIDGQRLIPGIAEAATEHDVMRFALPDAQAGGLEMMTDVEATARLGDPVVVLGNSGGGGVVTSLPGELVGIGPDRVEVSAEFIPGNSGSPIIHVPSGRVIGIATYLTRRYDEFSSTASRSGAAGGKKDESAVVIRRFGYRLDTVKQWQPLNWTAFQAEARSIGEISALTADVFDFLEALRTQKEPQFATATLRRPAEIWLTTIRRPHLSDADREGATRGFLGALRALVQADVMAAEGKFRYACFRDELRKEREVRNRLYKAFDEDAKAMSAPSIGRSR